MLIEGVISAGKSVLFFNVPELASPSDIMSTENVLD